MFRIVEFVVRADVLEKVEDEVLREGLREAKWETYHRGKGLLEYVSQPMVTTSALYFRVEQMMRRVFGDPSHLVKDVTSEYRLLRTRAPKAYDYGYVLDVGRVDGEFGEERLVAVPRVSVEYQSGRYASGLFSPVMCD